MDIVSSKPVSVLFVKEELSARKGEGAELGYEQSQALEHAEKVAVLTPAKHKKLVQDISEAGGMSEEAAMAVVDVMPSHASTLKAILMRHKVDLADAQAEEILKLMK